jgi:hypothetical protein
MMDKDLIQMAMATWARRNLPARLDVAETAKLLGFAEHDIPILMAARKLAPLGDPAPNAPKWFAAVEIIQRAADTDWLNKATKEVGKYWRHKRERRKIAHSGLRRGEQQARFSAEKVSPKSSPNSSPDEQFRSN